MPLSENVTSYRDVQSTLERAVEAEIGIRVTFSTIGEAIQFRQRCYKFRTLDRAESRKLWPDGDPRYGVSVYDDLVVTQMGVEVAIRRASARQLKIEELEV